MLRYTFVLRYVLVRGGGGGNPAPGRTGASRSSAMLDEAAPGLSLTLGL